MQPTATHSLTVFMGMPLSSSSPEEDSPTLPSGVCAVKITGIVCRWCTTSEAGPDSYAERLVEIADVRVARKGAPGEHDDRAKVDSRARRRGRHPRRRAQDELIRVRILECRTSVPPRSRALHLRIRRPSSGSTRWCGSLACSNRPSRGTVRRRRRRRCARYRRRRGHQALRFSRREAMSEARWRNYGRSKGP